ncbi:unnamed protein product [Rotaria sordida]|uniref:Phage tail collar domain-containing protein n=1 Tax=Rotaria sordida TaxID=392033 RepID=A0A819CPY2_9BILA|nr:unnamed protein product [Rotaria sordida]CAF3821560.1 unnamed protein product [Rotaria sordida]
MIQLFFTTIFFITVVLSDDKLPLLKRDNPSLGTAVVNTQILTILNYDGAQIYIYSSLSNENENAAKPQKWIFYYVPIMIPAADKNDTTWIWTVKNELRMTLTLGNNDVNELARKAIIKKYDSTIAQYAKSWDVAPLMIDSLMAFIVNIGSSPVEGIHPFRTVHPNSLSITFRFACSNEEKANMIMHKILDGDYEIEIAFYFAGFKQVSTNFVTITGDQLKDVLSKTTADGGNTNASYIHRNQASKFISNYVANVKMMIYTENANVNTSELITNLQNQFISLSQQAMSNSAQTILDAKLFDHVWSSTDLNPDRLTNEINKLFTYNKTETERHNFSDTYFDYNRNQVASSTTSGGGGISIPLLGIGVTGSGSVGSSSGSSLSALTNDVFSSTEIQNLLSQEAIEMQWTGEKFIPKSFKVYKLTDLTDRLQVAIIAKQLTADKVNGAIIRIVNTMSHIVETPIIPPPTILTGEIRLYAGEQPPELPWMICDGTSISRIVYQRLFGIIGTRYGTGDDVTTFNLPDFRGRQPIGVDTLQIRVNHATQLGLSGGKTTHTLTVEQLPAHKHGRGTLSLGTNGVHTHNHTDPGHNHGGITGSGPLGGSGRGMTTGGGADDQMTHTHTIPTDTAHIIIHNAGAHTHDLNGEMDSVGSNQEFSLINPYQVVQYIIYAGD